MIMSKEYAIKCNLMRLVDTRFAGIAKGVGTAKIKFGSIFLASSFTILDQEGMDFLFGLDMLRRHQGVIDLQKNVLRIQNEEVPFLAENAIPHLVEERNAANSKNGQSQAMDEDDDDALQNALMQSVQSQNQNNANSNSNEQEQKDNANANSNN